MKITDSRQMQAIDSTAITRYGIPEQVLMEHAGLKVTAVIREKFPDMPSLRAAIFCGKGNNGGDGFVIARLLHNAGANVAVFLMAHESDVKPGPSAVNLAILKKLKIPVYELTDASKIPHYQTTMLHRDLYVDALFGTGLTQSLEGRYAAIVEYINRFRKYVVAVDIPSGLSADSGQIPGPHIEADVTVTFGLPKTGTLIYPAAKSAGELIVADIGFPPAIITSAVCVA